MSDTHTFHIPVMGIGFTIDSPLKVSAYGIDSVISLVDDILMEKLREMYCNKYEIPYKKISEKVEDFRAKRITSYLNLINDLAEKKFEELKSATVEKGQEIRDFFEMLPDSSDIREEFKHMTDKYLNLNEISDWIKENLYRGSIDVNIMTKLDKDNYIKDEKLPVEYNDAHAALRGYANSDLESSLVLSAGMNPRLYSYIQKFDDFYPDENGYIKKKIALKVSDYRSALIQGKFLAKKGIWVSEYRIESGLNCGGHAFATDGYLMGPILDEFKNNRAELRKSVYTLLVRALTAKGRTIPSSMLPIKVTAQGGVGTAEEHRFLLEYYDIDSVGWGSPFLLVPEATTVDAETREKLARAREEDLYLSDISPLGVPFNSLRGNTKDLFKQQLIEKGRPGSSCPKKYLSSNTEFTEKSICTASRQYQHLKIKQLEEKNLAPDEYKKSFDKIVDKSCICVGLGTTALVNYGLDTRVEGKEISVCPGPNMAYFNHEVSLKEMVDHIYGRSSAFIQKNRPNMFVKELKLYLDYLKNKIEETRESVTEQQEKYLLKFASNLKEGISYYDRVFTSLRDKFQDTRATILKELEAGKKTLHALKAEIEKMSMGSLVE
ncbi:MAG TPA: hypothetical protein ENJ10_11125 [Caldithrix abyssi]|uniref:Uncharacterized protein n=1 Tax=Caldithrix abyssi TaxID=187145 RepID=A0A7V1LNM5_CALAY|nr:hypothetical protein [Caldithrix abyssi]